MPNADATYDVLIAIRDRMEGLEKTLSGMKSLGQNVDEINNKTGRLGSTFKAVFGANIAERALHSLKDAAMQAATAAFSLSEEIKDSSQNLDMAARPFQVLRQLVKDSGGDVGSFTMAVSAMNRAIVEARDVTSDAAGNFEKLGLNPAELEAQQVEERMESMAVAIKNSDDTMGAWRIAGQILGERTIPRLRGALEELAEKGYGALEEAMVNSGRILDDAEIARLDAASKMLDRKKLQATRLLGAAEAGTLGIAIGTETLPQPRRSSVEETQRLRDQATKLLLLRDAFQAAAEAEALFEGNPAKSDGEKRQHRINQLENELALLSQIRATLKTQPLASDETARERAKQLQELNRQYLELDNRLKAARGDGPDALANLRERVAGLNDRHLNPQALTIGQGAQAGVLQWMEQLGSRGEQVAGVIQEGLGGAVSSVAAKLSGNDVRSWGDVWRSVLQGILQQMIQVQLQMALVKAFMGVFDLGSAIGGGGVPGVPAAVPSFASPGKLAPTITLSPGRARGGDVEVGQIYPVNEKGFSEVFIPRVPGYISPSTMLSGEGRRGRGAGGLVVGDVHLHITTGVQETVRAEFVQLAPMIQSMVPNALREAIARGEFQTT